MTTDAPTTSGDDVVDLAAERVATGIDDFLAEFNRRLIGLRPVKQRIDEIASLLLVDRVRSQLGLVVRAPTLHMSFSGNPGTGKTTVAEAMAEILHRLGFLRTARMVSVTRDDLVGEYIGHTAPKTKKVLEKAAGGVLFIDEAYYLYRPENERDYGQEAIEILLQVMEDQRDDLVVILAGYADRMDRFFASNPGFRSRIAHHVDFPDYDDDELVAIGELLLREQNYSLTDDAKSVLRRYVEARRSRPHFANARSIRNALDRARLRQAARHVAAGTVAVDQLSVIDADDLLASRVFAEPTGTEPNSV